MIIGWGAMVFFLSLAMLLLLTLLFTAHLVLLGLLVVLYFRRPRVVVGGRKVRE